MDRSWFEVLWAPVSATVLEVYNFLVCGKWSGFDGCLVVGLLDDCLYGW